MFYQLVCYSDHSNTETDEDVNTGQKLDSDWRKAVQSEGNASRSKMYRRIYSYSSSSQWLRVMLISIWIISMALEAGGKQPWCTKLRVHKAMFTECTKVSDHICCHGQTYSLSPALQQQHKASSHYIHSIQGRRIIERKHDCPHNCSPSSIFSMNIINSVITTLKSVKWNLNCPHH